MRTKMLDDAKLIIELLLLLSDANDDASDKGKREAAQRWLAEYGESQSDPWYVLVQGGLATGIREVYGPFDVPDEAKEYGRRWGLEGCGVWPVIGVAKVREEKL